MHKTILSVVITLFGSLLNAQWVITSLGVTGDTVTFESTFSGLNNSHYNGSGLASVPGLGKLDSDGWMITGMSDGATAWGGTYTTTNDFARGVSTGGVTTGGLYAFVVASGDTAIGVQPAGSDWNPGMIIMRLINATGSDVDTVAINYDLLINNDQGRASYFNLFYGINSTTSPVAVTSLNDTSTMTSQGSIQWITYPKSESVPMTLANGDTLYLIWKGGDVSGSGSRDEFALDNIAVEFYTGPNCNDSVSLSVTSASCYGENDGAVSATVYNANGTVSYSWNTGGSNSSISNLTAGNYTVTITDAMGCSVTATDSVSQPDSISLSFTTTSATCYGGNNGTASVSVNGGTASYYYYWSGGSTTATISNCMAGVYFVTVTDANGCTAADSAVVTQPSSAVTVQIINTTNVDCYGNATGGASANASGGTSPYSYSWTGGSSTYQLSNVTAGYYYVTATDNNGCTGTTYAQITQPNNPVNVNITNTHNVTCLGFANGNGTASATGGTGSKTFVWSTSATTATINGLAPGTYTVTATDQNGCTATSSFTVTQPATSVTVSATTSANNPCYGNQLGAASASGSGGTGALFYMWSNAVVGTNSITNLPAGTYTVTVSDTKSCSATASTVVTQPTELIVDPIITNEKCEGQHNGKIDANVSGGTSPYSINWSNSQTTEMITNLAAGSYTVTVTDNNGCTASASATVNPGNPYPTPDLGPDQTIEADSFVLYPGSYTTYFWQDGSSDSIFVVTVSGAYAVTVYDANGCTGEDEVMINIYPAGLDEIKAGEILLFPIPTKESVTIVSQIIVNSLAIRDARGSLIQSELVKEKNFQIPLNTISPGVYFIELDTEKGSTIRRLLVE